MMDKHTFFTKITHNTIVLTPNRRLAAHLVKSYDNHQQQNKTTAWPSITCLPFNSWLTTLWDNCLQYQQGALLLNTHQEQYLWQRIIKKSTMGSELLRIHTTAKQAIEAWRLIHHWQITLDPLLCRQHLDWQQFYNWSHQFKQLCKENNYLDQHLLLETLINLVQQGKLKINQPITLFGFDECSPLQLQLLDALAQTGSQYEFVDIDVNNESCQQIAVTNTMDELETMARWAKQCFEEDPNSKIGCIIPNLTEIRSEIEKTFTKIFAPETFIRLQRPQHLPFNISAGLSLRTFPILHCALLLLKLNSPPIALTDISLLLRSPFIKSYFTEALQRAQVDAALHDLGTFNFELRQLLPQIQKLCPQLTKSLYKFNKLILPKQAQASQWAIHFSEILDILGWPGDRELDSVDYQLFSRFQELLAEFASLDHVCESFDYQNALSHLNQLAQETIFQAQSMSKPIQILGALEAAGISFDKIWVTSLDNTRWPTAPKPNPFIPMAIQRKLQLPHASAQRELEFSKKLLRRFQQSSKALIFSYCLQEDDRQLAPSALLNDSPTLTKADLCLAHSQSLEQRLFQSSDLETIEDLNAPTITSEELSHIRGGTFIFKHQAACPFRAFARFRLNAVAIDAPELGLSALERGSLIHTVLELFWKRLSSHQELIQLTDLALDELLDEIIALAIKQLMNDKLQISPQFFTIEKQRLKQLLTAWLELEKQRQDFTVVATEQKQTAIFQDLPLQLRIDRIDQLANGDYVIIDYKTGITSINSWFGARPDEPQLPLYSILSENAINGILFAQVKPNQLAYKGVAAHNMGINGIKNIAEIKCEDSAPDWQQQKKQWQQDLARLAEDFIKGIAKIDPKDGTKTCDYCDLQSLCRINQ